MPKTCKVCKEKFEPFNTLQRTCSPKCALQDKKARETLEKHERRELMVRKEKLKSRSDHIKSAQTACNKWIRLRDKDEGCISCDKPATWSGQWHASHYRPTSTCTALRFHPFNINKACSECNTHKSGNLIEYRIGLIKKVGIEAVEWLEAQNRSYKWDIDEVKEIDTHFKLLIKELDER